MKLRPGVSLWGLKVQASFAMGVLDNIVRSYPVLPELEITHVTDGVHKKNSLHPKGLAFDFHCRSWGPMRGKVFANLRNSLGKDFDVLHEDPDGPNEHGHVEYDPKTVPQ